MFVSAARVASLTVSLAISGALAAQPVITSFTASPSQIGPGQSSTLAWSTTGATAALITEEGPAGPGGGGGQVTVPVNGTLVVTPPGTTRYTLAAVAGEVVTSAQVTVTVSCPGPSVPAFASFPSAPAVAGSVLTVAWTPTLADDPDGRYHVEIGEGPACGTRTTLVTARPAVEIPTRPSEPGEVCVVVRPVSGQGCPGPATRELRLAVALAPPAFALLAPPPPLAAERGVPLLATATVPVKNLGTDSLILTLVTGDTFYSFAPSVPTGVPPGVVFPVVLSYAPAPTSESRLFRGNLLATWSEASGAFRSVSAPVFLAVLPPIFDGGPGARLTAVGSDEVHFRTSGSASPLPVDVTVRNVGTRYARLRPSISPGGSWLSVSGDFATSLPPGGTRVFRLEVDRGRRTTEESVPPLVTVFRLENADGPPEEGVSFRVFDEEVTPSSVGGSRPGLAAGRTSLFIGSAVSAVGAGAVFVSDGWIRNRGPDPADVELYFTPNGADGISDWSVRKAAVTVPPYGTRRLADFLPSLFEATSTSGQVEVRSSSLAQLSVRTTVDAVTSRAGTTARYGAEIPIVLSGQGARRTGPSPSRVVLPGVRSSAAGFRTNLILAETAGEPVTLDVRLYDASGALAGRKTVPLKAFSKDQVNSTDGALFPPGAIFDGGTLVVVPVDGNGTVTAFATVLDNASQSYATRVGQVVADSVLSGTPASGAVGPAFLPAVARASAANRSFYTTSLVAANLAPSETILVLTFFPDGGGASLGPRQLRLPPRGEGPRAVTFADLLGEFFDVTASTAGMLRVDGDRTRVAVASETSTPVDLDDLSKGRSISAVNPAPGGSVLHPGLFDAETPEAVGAPDSGAAARVVWHPGIEEGAAFRTNLILAEIAGRPATVLVALTGRASGGALLASKSYDLDPFERLQVNKVVRELVGTGYAGLEVSDVELSVRALSGAGRVLAMVTRIDNDPASKRADILTLGPAIPPCGTCVEP